MAIFNSFLYVYQRVINGHATKIELGFMLKKSSPWKMVGIDP